MLPVLCVQLGLQVRELAQIILEEVGQEGVRAKAQVGGLNTPGRTAERGGGGQPLAWAQSPALATGNSTHLRPILGV